LPCLSFSKQLNQSSLALYCSIDSLTFFHLELLSFYATSCLFNFILSLSHTLTHKLTHSLTLSFPLSLSLSHTHTHKLTLFLSFPLSLSLSHTHTHTLTLALSVFLFLTREHYIYLSVSLSPLTHTNINTFSCAVYMSL
jgi:hypothetical protein